MNMTTSDIELYSASDIQVDASVIDVSEVETQDDKDFLVHQGTAILTIDAKADFAIKKIVATIQGRANLEKGKVIAEVQDHFHEQDGRGSGLRKWYASISLTASQAVKFAQAYRTTQEFAELFDGLVDPLKVLECSDATLNRIQTLPQKFKEEVMAEVAVGNVPTSRDVVELQQKPEVKLSKALELLERAKARKVKADERWEEVKADPEITVNHRVDEYRRAQANANCADKSIQNFEKQVAELTELVEAEKLKTAESEAREAKAQAELQKLKFDDAKARNERIKRLTSSLTVGVPQALADLQKFFAEKDHYPEEVRDHVLEQATQLANYIGDQL
jgi:hypothetical protein